MKAIWSIATTTVGEAIRRRVLLIILLIGLLILTIAPGLSVLSARSETTTLVSMMFAVLQGVSALIAIILTVYMIPNEIERRTIYTILSKPVQRWQFLVGKYLGAVLALALMMGLMSAVMLGVFYFQQQPDLARMAELAKGPILYFVQMCLLAAVAIFFSTFTTPIVNFFLSTGLYGVGTVLNPVYETFASNNTNEFVKKAAQIITTVLPNFGNYNVQNPIINPGQIIANETVFYINAAVYGVFYIAVLLVGGILIFDRREV